jgi:hypothetical protein
MMNRITPSKLTFYNLSLMVLWTILITSCTKENGSLKALPTQSQKNYIINYCR